MDFILNGQGHGSVAARMMAPDFDITELRPYLGGDGRSYIDRTVNGKAIALPTMNAVATLRKDEWALLDDAVIRAAKPRLKAVADLRSRGLEFNIGNGMAKTVLQYERMSDISGATTSMDGARRSEGARPVFDLVNLPLPIIHKDFHYSARQVLASRQSANYMGGGTTPLDTTTAELAARRVAEEAERLLLGVAASYTFGGGTIYGYTNHPNRLTKSMTVPTSSNGNVVVQEILNMRTALANVNHFGPYMVYCSLSWDEFMDGDYSTAKGTETLRDRISRIDGILGVQTLDYLPAKTLLVVEMQPDTIREVVGMEIMTLQWESEGGMVLNYKVMGILVPQIRLDILNQIGINHGTHA